MAVNNNFYSAINDLVAQAMGSDAVDVVDYASFIDAGQKITSLSGTDVQNGFVSALMNKLALSVNTYRAYEGKFRELRKGIIGAGNTIEMIMYHFYDAIAAGFTPDALNAAALAGTGIDQYQIYKPDVEAYYYTNTNAYTIPITIQRTELIKAWTTPAAMDRFISGLLGSIINSNEKIGERFRVALLASLVDDSANDTNAKVVDSAWVGQPGTCYKLVSMYNDTYNPTVPLTQATALNDPDFIAFAVEVINTVLGAIGEVSTEYNLADIETFSPSESRTLYVSSIFAAKAKRVYSNTYNPQYNMLADYTPVGAWQGGQTPLAIQVDGGTGDDREYLCLACIVDDFAAGEWITSSEMDVTPYNARGKYWNNFFNVESRGVVNHGANFVSFLLDEPEEEPEP